MTLTRILCGPTTLREVADTVEGSIRAFCENRELYWRNRMVLWNKDTYKDFKGSIPSAIYNMERYMLPKAKKKLNEKADQFLITIRTLYANRTYPAVVTHIFNKSLIEDITAGQGIPKKRQEFIVECHDANSEYHYSDLVKYMDKILMESQKRLDEYLV